MVPEDGIKHAIVTDTGTVIRSSDFTMCMTLINPSSDIVHGPFLSHTVQLLAQDKNKNSTN
jgi:hypothetical protein